MRDRSIGVRRRGFLGGNDLKEERQLLETTLMLGVKGESARASLHLRACQSTMRLDECSRTLSRDVAKLRGRLRLRL